MGNVSPKKKYSQATVRVKYAFKATKPGQITVAKGDALLLIGEPNQGWIQVQSVKGDKRGIVPMSFLDFSDQDQALQTQPMSMVCEVRVPRSVKPGQQFKVKHGDQYVYLICPADAKPGTVIRFKLAENENAPPPAPAPIHNAAVEHAECPVCFQEMYTKPVATLTYQKRRSCNHFVHYQCARALLSSGLLNCPVCEANFDSTEALPDMDADPMRWFDAVDFDGNKHLSRDEVIEVLKAVCPVNYRELEKNTAELWSKWDANGDNEISFIELQPLMKFVRDSFKPVPQVHAPALGKASPEKVKWFKFFDEDESGFLDQDEVMRGLVKTYDLSRDLKRIKILRDSIEVLWAVCDTDGSGYVELDEFTTAGGLADQLIAMMKDVAVPTEPPV